MGTPLLNLDTLVVRPKITIDGENYDILSPDELPVLTSHSLANKGKRMEELSSSAELKKAEQTELRDLVHSMSDAIMEPVPPDVRAKLSDPQRLSVIEAFSMLLLTGKAGTAAALMKSLLPGLPGLTGKKNSTTGGKRSRASSDSTAARRGGGSPKRRSRS